MSEPDVTARLVAALADPGYRYSGEQVAYLMAESARWGREAERETPGPAWPPEPVVLGGRWFDQADRRRRADVEARKARPGDFLGGLPKPAVSYGRSRLGPCPRGPQVWLTAEDRGFLRRCGELMEET